MSTPQWIRAPKPFTGGTLMGSRSPCIDNILVLWHLLFRLKEEGNEKNII